MKPENVLKRSHELMGVGQSQAALVLLHEHITSKRSRNVPIQSLEPVMLLLVEQSVEQKKGKLAKDALYQYKNISQNTNVGTIEVGSTARFSVSGESADAFLSWCSRNSSS
jgi:translation initiation factor 3 subunit A